MLSKQVKQNDNSSKSNNKTVNVDTFEEFTAYMDTDRDNLDMKALISGSLNKGNAVKD